MDLRVVLALFLTSWLNARSGCVLLLLERFISVLMVNKDINVLWLCIRAVWYMRDNEKLELSLIKPQNTTLFLCVCVLQKKESHTGLK